MEMVNCPRCGKVFARMSEPICDSCAKEEERLFETVRDYINENPGNRLEEVALACNISVKKIMRYIRDGRIEVSAAIAGEVRCERCGRPIRRGKLCDTCVVSVNQAVSEMFDPSRKPAGPIMHTRPGGR
jgi:flagellar operon protein (TIGR03826 family)